MKLKKTKALRMQDGNLLVEAENHWLLATPDGNFIKWSSRQEFFKLANEGAKEIYLFGEIEIPLEQKSIFTLWSGRRLGDQPAENREVTLQEIFSMREGDKLEYKTEIGDWGWFSGIEILRANKTERLVMSYVEEINKGIVMEEIYMNFGKICLVTSIGNVFHLCELPKMKKDNV